MGEDLGPERPSGWRRRLFRAPVQVYRSGLGWVFGGRFLMLAHTGRRSGLVRRTVVEVVERDREADAYVICSGYGKRSDWYRNLKAGSRASILIGRRRVRVRAEFPGADEGGELMVRYASRRPRAATMLAEFMEYRVDGTEAGFRELGRRLPFVRLRAIGE